MIKEKAAMNFLIEFNNRNYFVFVIITLLFSHIAFAQDTIVMRNNQKVCAKIIEINTSEVKYKRFDYQDGPLFIVLKWDLKYIQYANGAKDNFENVAMPKAKTNDSKDVTFQPFGNFKYYYQTKVITEQNMLDIVKKLDDKKLNLLIKKTNDYRTLKTTFKYVGFGLAATSFLTLVGVVNFKNTTVAATSGPPARGGRGRNNAAQQAAQKQRRADAGYLFLGAITSGLVSVTFNLKEIKHAHLTADIYNRYVSE